MKVLDPRVHGFFDYAAVVVLLLGPLVLGFDGLAAAICYLLAAAFLGLSLLTAYPLGVARLIPFQLHGGVELVTAFFLVLAPWVLGFSAYDGSRPFYVVAGLGLGLLWLFTDYKAAPDPYRGGRFGRERVWTH